jgi:hypothetical protein
MDCISSLNDVVQLFLIHFGTHQSATKRYIGTMTVPTAIMRQGLISYTNAAGNNTTLTPANSQAWIRICAANGTCPCARASIPTCSRY